jgi:hypothetical protein
LVGSAGGLDGRPHPGQRTDSFVESLNKQIKAALTSSGCAWGRCRSEYRETGSCGCPVDAEFMLAQADTAAVPPTCAAPAPKQPPSSRPASSCPCRRVIVAALSTVSVMVLVLGVAGRTRDECVAELCFRSAARAAGQPVQQLEIISSRKRPAPLPRPALRVRLPGTWRRK